MPKPTPKTPVQPSTAPKPETPGVVEKPQCQSSRFVDKKEVIKEIELKSYLELTRVLMGAAYGFQRRIANGATIESTDAYSLTCDDYDPDDVANSLADPLVSLYAYGVEVESHKENGKLPGPIQAARELEFISGALNIYRNYEGCNTPTEELIVNLVNACTWREALTPAAVEGYALTFKDSFNDAIEDARRMFKQYPELVQGGHDSNAV